MKTIHYCDAQEIVVADKEYDGQDNWNEEFCEFLTGRGKEIWDWDDYDLWDFFKSKGYEIVV